MNWIYYLHVNVSKNEQNLYDISGMRLTLATDTYDSTMLLLSDNIIPGILYIQITSD